MEVGRLIEFNVFCFLEPFFKVLSFIFIYFLDYIFYHVLDFNLHLENYNRGLDLWNPGPRLTKICD